MENEQEKSTIVPEAAGPQRLDRLKLALILSMGLNLLVLGLGGGFLLGGRMHGGGPGPDMGFGPAMQAIPGADRLELARKFRDKAPELREEAQSMRQDFTAFAQGLRAPAWDRAAAEAILEHQASRRAELQKQGVNLFLDYVAGLDQNARAELADRIDEALSHRRWHFW